MSFGAGGLAQMTYNNNNGFPSGGISAPGAGFGGRSRLNAKRLSVALPPKVAPINEDQVDLPTPRTSRSHLLAGLRTQPKTPSVPASAPYNQTQHPGQGANNSMWAEQGYSNGYNQGVPQTATGAGFDMNNQYAVNAGRQTYSLPEQVLAPPSMYGEEEMDPSMLQHMQMTSVYLAQRQQQLQQQLASLTSAAQGMNINGQSQRNSFQQLPQQAFNQQQQIQQLQQQQLQIQSPIEVPGQPGVYLVYNPQIQGYSYVVDQAVQQQASMTMSPNQQAAPGFNGTPPNDNMRAFLPPKKAPSPPSAMEHVQPLPPPSATAFRRGHKKANSLSINPVGNAADGPKTSSAATFGSQRAAFPPTPMTGTFGPGQARAGEHSTRQPRGPPAIEELTSAPTSLHEGSKNFATRQRRRALDSLMKAGTQRRGVSRSSGGSPVSEREYNFNEENEDFTSLSRPESRKMSPIGSEMKEKRASQGSNDGYFGLSSASSSEGEDFGAFKQPPTPATPATAGGGDRKKMMLGVLSAAEKRRSFVM